MQPISVTEVSPGVARLAWGPTPPEPEQVRALVAGLLTEHRRVEVHVGVDDQAGQRAALWAGLRREVVARGLDPEPPHADLVVHARVAGDPPVTEPDGFRAMLNSYLPHKRAIGQLLIHDPDDRVLLCQLTYKQDWDLPGGVIEVGENPRTGVLREVREELGLDLTTRRLLLTDWMPAWRGWEDALCLVFDGGVHESGLTETVVREEREIAAVAFLSPDEVAERATDFTARRVASALRAMHEGTLFSESGQAL